MDIIKYIFLLFFYYFQFAPFKKLGFPSFGRFRLLVFQMNIINNEIKSKKNK